VFEPDVLYVVAWIDLKERPCMISNGDRLLGRRFKELHERLRCIRTGVARDLAADVQARESFHSHISTS
jgi:hypothetical protein